MQSTAVMARAGISVYRDMTLEWPARINETGVSSYLVSTRTMKKPRLEQLGLEADIPMTTFPRL